MLSSEQIELAVKRYLTGESPTKIAADIGLKRTTFRSLLERQGVLRSQSEAGSVAAAAGRKDKALKALITSAQGKSRFHPGKSIRTRKFACELCGELVTNGTARQRWCRVCVPNHSWRGRAQRYGIGTKQWDAWLTIQGGTCALCPAKPVYVDHDHSDGRVRGLVCPGCNIKLAGVDDPEWMVRALQYARR